MSNRGRITGDQKHRLLEFMRTKHDVLFGSLAKDISAKRTEWEAIALELNNLGPPYKVAECWRRCWSDMRKNTRDKLVKIRQHNERYGNDGPPCLYVRTPEDDLVIDIVGLDDVDEESSETTVITRSEKRMTKQPLENIAKNEHVSKIPKVPPVNTTTMIDPKVHKCIYCPEIFSLSGALLVHKLKCHPVRSITAFLDELQDSEILYSSDDQYNYSFTFTTTFQRSPKHIKQETMAVEDEARSVPPEMTIVKMEPQDFYEEEMLVTPIELIECISSKPASPKEDNSMSDWQNDDVESICPIPEDFLAPMEATQHDVVDTNKGIICPICKSPFARMSTLANHYNKKHPRFKRVTTLQLIAAGIGTSDICSCTLCNVEFLSGDECAEHLLMVHNDVVQRIDTGQTEIFKCHMCPETRVPFIRYRQHLLHHDPRKRYKTDLCGTCGTLTADLKRHVLKHQENQFLCDVCNKTYWSKRNLQEHMRMHIGFKQFVCVFEGCDASYTWRYGLTQHISLRHSTDQLHVCGYCGKKYSLAARLRDHVTMHTGERRFKCKTCGNTFRKHSQLSIHNRRRHTGERPYKCTVCLKAFHTNQSRNNHMNRKRGCVPPEEDVDADVKPD